MTAGPGLPGTAGGAGGDAGAASPRGLLDRPAAAGLSMLEALDSLGGWVERRHAARRAAVPPSSRLSPYAGAVLGAGLVLAGLFSWGAVEGTTGASQWMTAPGAGNAEDAAETATAPVAAETATAPAAAGRVGVTATAAAPTVHESLVVVPGSMTGHPGWPEFVGSKTIDFPAHSTVVLTIYSFDTGSSPLAKGLPYDKVSGTVGGSETVNGTSTTHVVNAQLAHTFTVPGLGLNIAIPVAATPKKGQPLEPVVVTATFHLGKAGSYTWQCYAPCGTGANGEQGPMMTPGYMTGEVVVA